MPSGSYNQVYALCPFYKWDDGKKRIACEGIVDESSIALIYHRREDYNIQFKTFCCEHYTKCEIHNLLMEKYEDNLEFALKVKKTCVKAKRKKAGKKEIERQMCLFDMQE